MKKIGIIFLLAMFSLLHLSCGNEGCGGPYSSNEIYKPAVYFDTDKKIYLNDSISYKLVFPENNYYFENKSTIPLLLKNNKMVFEVTKQGVVIDSIIILYKIEPKYIKPTECYSEKYVPFATINNCYSTGRFFNITNYLAVN